MPESVIAVIAATVMSLFGVSFRKIDQADRRMDALELKVAENYVTKAEFRDALKKLTVDEVPISLTGNELTALVQRFDQDGDGSGLFFLRLLYLSYNGGSLN